MADSISSQREPHIPEIEAKDNGWTTIQSVQHQNSPFLEDVDRRLINISNLVSEAARAFLETALHDRVGKAPSSHRNSVSTASAAGGSGTRSSSWSAKDDETLIQARAQGLN